jgi:hypothetical protein
MSGYTMTMPEVKYSFAGTGTQLNTFTTEASLQGACPLCVIPAEYFTVLGKLSKTMRIKAFMRAGTTAATPTFTWSLRMLAQTATWTAGGLLLGSTAALTSVASQTLAPVAVDAEVSLSALSVGGASTLKTFGEVRSPKFLASPFSGTIPDNNVAPTVATYDDSQWYSLWLSVACQTSNAANLCQLEMLKVYTEN